jgi:hypothetical protein
MGQDPSRYDLIIQEVYADPNPSRGLPNGEFIEIRNRSGKDLNLRNWLISNGTTTGKISANFMLKHDSLALLVSSGSMASYSPFGAVASVSPFPSLNNEGDTLQLLSPAGITVHALAWDRSWYGNEVKENGGWSIELRDPQNPCAQKENWGASVAALGGTPGRKNSIAAVIKDSSSPKMQYAYITDSMTLFAVFNEPLSPSISLNDIQIDNATLATSASLLPPLFNTVQVKLNSPLKKETIYTLQLKGISDCIGNRSTQQVPCGILSSAQPGDIIINEILFDPPSSGSDYLELVNTSRRIIDMRSLMIANRNSLGKISSLVQLTRQSRPFFPGDYLVLSADTGWLMQTYQPGVINKLAMDLPSYPDTEGDVVLLDNLGNILEELRYSNKWHYQLISNPEGVALERIIQDQPAQNQDNWHSASTSSGYGTPGKINSQQLTQKKDLSTWSFSTRIISPDGDGRDDLLIIGYSFLQPGFMTNLLVYNAAGKPVKKIVQNALCGTTGFFRWDGSGEAGARLPRGHYIVYAEVYGLDGTLRRTREVVGLW